MHHKHANTVALTCSNNLRRIFGQVNYYRCSLWNYWNTELPEKRQRLDYKSFSITEWHELLCSCGGEIIRVQVANSSTSLLLPRFGLLGPVPCYEKIVGRNERDFIHRMWLRYWTNPFIRQGSINWSGVECLYKLKSNLFEK